MTEKINHKLDLIADMLLTLMGRNLEIGFKEVQEYEEKLKEINKQFEL